MVRRRVAATVGKDGGDAEKGCLVSRDGISGGYCCGGLLSCVHDNTALFCVILMLCRCWLDISMARSSRMAVTTSWNPVTRLLTSVRSGVQLCADAAQLAASYSGHQRPALPAAVHALTATTSGKKLLSDAGSLS